VSSALAELLEASKGAKKDDWEAQERITTANDAIADRIGDLAATLQKLPSHAQETEEDKLGVEVVEMLTQAQRAIEASQNDIVKVLYLFTSLSFFLAFLVSPLSSFLICSPTLSPLSLLSSPLSPTLHSSFSLTHTTALSRCPMCASRLVSRPPTWVPLWSKRRSPS
jgi:hypothetical protein